MKNPLDTIEYLIHIRQNEKAKQVLDIMKPLASDISQWNDLGKYYAEIREFNDCLELAYKIYGQCNTKQDKWNARVNIIRAYLNLNKPEDALKYIEINERIDLTDHPNRMDKAMVYFLLNRKEEGEAILRKILEEPHNDDIDKRVKFNLGTYDLANGKFKEGLKGFLLEGHRLNIWEKSKLPPQNMWRGEPAEGKTLVMHFDGGIGDEIINVRFQRHLKERGITPVWYTTRKDLAAVFKRCGFNILQDLNEYQPDWLWTYSMSIPAYLDIEPDVLWNGPYLHPIGKKERLPGRLKIGLKCFGNQKYDQDLHRSLPIDQVMNCLPDHAAIYSFHIEEDIQHPRIIPLKNHINSWDDTLDYIDQVDIMVTSCTSTAHAASAMGKKTIVIVPILNYYVWALRGPHSPWYSKNTLILRQQKYDTWEHPLKELKDYMHEHYQA